MICGLCRPWCRHRSSHGAHRTTTGPQRLRMPASLRRDLPPSRMGPKPGAHSHIARTVILVTADAGALTDKAGAPRGSLAPTGWPSDDGGLEGWILLRSRRDF
jgi:hypothetical protein